MTNESLTLSDVLYRNFVTIEEKYKVYGVGTLRLAEGKNIKNMAAKPNITRELRAHFGQRLDNKVTCRLCGTTSLAVINTYFFLRLHSTVPTHFSKVLELAPVTTAIRCSRIRRYLSTNHTRMPLCRVASVGRTKWGAFNVDLFQLFPTRGTLTTALPAHAPNWGSAKCSGVGVHWLYLWKTLLRSNLARLQYYFFFASALKTDAFCGPSRSKTHKQQPLLHWPETVSKPNCLHYAGLF